MEEKNVRWGELVGGLLVVGGSVALVITFWKEIAERELLKFGLFNGILAALFALGFYTERKWKLPTTSRALLVIATLLVPLNFLVIAAVSDNTIAAAPPLIAGEVVSAALFAGLVYWAARTITPAAPIALAAGVLGSSVAQLFVRRWAGPEMSLLLLDVLGGAPLLCHAGATAVGLAQARRREPLDEPHVHGLFRLLGLTAFAALAPCGMLLNLSGQPGETLHRLAPLVALAGTPSLAAGLLLWRRLRDSQLTGLRTAGTAVAVLGSAIMLGGLALAWPEPALLVAVAAVVFLVLTWVALADDLPAAHFAAGLAIVCGGLVALHALRGELSWWNSSTSAALGTIFSAASGNALAGLAFAYVLAAAGWRRLGRPRDALHYLLFAPAVAAASLVLVTLFGLRVAGDPYGATWVYALYAVAAIGGSIALSRSDQRLPERIGQLPVWLAWAGSALIALMVVQGAVYRPQPHQLLVAPWTTSAIVHGGIVLGVTIAVRAWRRKRDGLQEAFERSAIVTSIAAALLVFFGALSWERSPITPLDSAILAALVAIEWFVAAALRKSPRLFAAAQGGVFAAAALAGIDYAAQQTWWLTSPNRWTDPRLVQVLGCAGIVVCLVWTIARIAVDRLARRHSRAEQFWLATVTTLLRPSWPAVDHLATAAVLLAAAGLALYAGWPGVVQELSPRAAVAELARHSPELVLRESATRTVIAAAAFELPDIAHAPAAASATWLLLALVALTLVAGLWEGVNRWRLMGLVLGAGAACPLWAARCETSVAVASALGWMLAGFFVLGSVAVWQRNRLALWGARLGWSAAEEPRERLAGPVIASLLLLAPVPLVALAGYLVAVALSDNLPVGPAPGSLFASISLAVNYSIPVALTALVLVGYAIRERSATFAFVAGLVTNLAATVAYLFTAGQGLSTQDPRLWAQLGLLNALVAALFGLAWQGATVWRARRDDERPPLQRLQVAQSGLALSLLLLVLGSAATFPPTPPAWLTSVAGLLGISALMTAFALAFWLSIGRSRVVTTALAAVALWSVGTELGAGAVAWDTGNWLAIHVLLMARMIAPGLVIGGGWWWYRREVLALDDRPRLAITIWSSLSALSLLFVSFRCMGNTAPGEPWWSSAGILSAGLLATFLAIWSCRRAFLHAASALVVVAVFAWYVRGPWFVRSNASNELFAVFHVFLLALALPVVAWLSIELRWIRPQRDPLGGLRLLAAHRSASWLAVLVLGLMTAIGIAADAKADPIAWTLAPGGLAVLATGIAACACLWDLRARESVAVLYLYGLVLVGVFLDLLDLQGDRLLFTGTVALGAFTLATSYLWSRRAGLRAFAERLGMPASEAAPNERSGWIRALTTLLIVAVIALAYATVLACDDKALRISAGFAAIFQLFSLGMLAQGTGRTSIQRDALLTGALGAVAFSWAFVAPSDPYSVLNRSVATCLALVVTTLLYAFGLARLPLRLSDWVAAAQRFAPACVAALGVSVAAVLGQEVFCYLDLGAVPLGWPSRLAVAVSLVMVFAASLAAALLPGRDPLNLGQRGRTAYVYLAEVVLALVFLHVRLTLPWLFQGIFLAWWPLIVMAIAFLGVGLAEWFGRRQQPVLAEPLEKTGILLPLLPVVAFWFVQPQQYQTDYSLVLLVVGGLYAALAVTRKSTGFGLLAALAANGGLWHFLHRLEGVGLLEHPQLWLIPPALCVLAAAYLNRDRLTAQQMTTIRYITSLTIYLSSTADIFLQGVAQAPWLPVALAVLAVLGVLVGIMLRVRAFLFLGSGFLLLAIVTMIWHVAVDLEQVWAWPAALVVLGVAVLVFFGVGEKRRHDMLRVVDQLKQWQP